MNNRILNKILYVEDEPDIAAIAQIALEDIGGFTIYSCNSGQEALDAVTDFHPDLVLLDVMMPCMDGLATLLALRKIPEFAQVPIIFMTAKIQPHEIPHYLALGALDVIAKPFDSMTLAENLRECWRRIQS